MKWISKPFITPLDVLIMAGAGQAGHWIGWWSIAVAIPLLLVSCAVERRYWRIEGLSRP